MKLFTHIIFWAIGIALVATVAYFGLSEKKNPDEQLFTVTQRDVVQSVQLSGEVAAVNQLDLSFESAGKIKNVFFNQGQEVATGTLLAELDHDDLDADLLYAQGAIQSARAAIRSAEASVQKAEANLSLVQAQNRGTDSSIASAQTKLANTITEQKTLVSNAYKELLSNDLQAYAIDSNKTLVVPLITGTYQGSETGSIEFDFYSSAARTGNSARITGLITGNVSFDIFGNPEQIGASTLFITLPTAGNSYNNSEWTIPIPNTRSTTYQAKLSAYENAKEVQTQKVSQAESELNKLISEQANEDSLAVTTAQAQQASAAIEEARANLLQSYGSLKQAEANVAQIEAKISNTKITAPFTGTIALQSYKAGQNVTANGASGITLITSGEYELEMSVPEIDISKITIGDKARVRLDVYSTDVEWIGQLTETNLVETEVDGVPVYTSKIRVTNPDERIRVGMNARALIEINRADKAVAIPASYIISNNDTYTVLVKISEHETEERIITLGLLGTDNFYEVTTGLQSGEKIVKPATQ